MSSTLSTQVMVAELARRVPIGYSANVAIDALNGALRWINQQGSFPWLLRKVTVSLTAGSGEFAMPADFDAGKQAVLYGTEAQAVPTEIPFMTWSDAVKNQVSQAAGSATGSLACWTFFAEIATATVTLKGHVFPISAVKTEVLPFIYHSVKFPALTSAANIYFPTPDHFDYFIVELAEAEIMRQYRLDGWEILYKRVTDQLRAMLQAYTTTKMAMAPTPELVNAAQGVQAQKAS